MKLNNLLTRSVLISVVVLLMSCSAGGSREQITQNDPVAAPDQAFVVSGRVVKGAISGASVFLFDAETNLSIASGLTDQEGRFNLSVPAQYYRKPVFVEADLSGGIMACDLESGCDGINFGDDVLVPVDGDYRLESGVAELTEQSSVNVSVITTIAYRIASSSIGNNWATKFSSANAQVSAILNLPGLLHTISPIDITEVAEYSSASIVEMRYSLFNAALIQAGMAVGGSSYLDAIEIAVQSVAGYSASNSVVAPQFSKTDLLQETVDLVRDAGLIDVSVVRVASAVSAELQFLSFSSQNNTWRAPNQNFTPISPLNQVKSFLQEIREVANSVDFASLLSLAKLENLTSGEVFEVTKVFGVDVTEEREELKSLPSYLSVLASVAKVVFVATTEYYSNNTLPSIIDGIELNASIEDGNLRFLINQNIKVCDTSEVECDIQTNLNVLVAIDRFAGNPVQNYVSLEGVTMNLTGEMFDEGSNLVLQSGGVIQSPLLRMQFTFEDEAKTQISALDFSVYDFNVSLPISIQSQVQSNTSGILDLKGNVIDLLYDYARLFSNSGGEIYDFIENVKITVNEFENVDLTLALNQGFESQHDNFMAINLAQAGGAFTTGLQFISDTFYECQGAVFNDELCQEVTSETAFEGEDEAFLELVLTMFGTSSIHDRDVPAMLTISGERKSPSENSINSLNVSGNGRALQLRGTFNSIGGITELEGTNINGAIIDIYSSGRDRLGFVRDFSGEEGVDMLDMGEWLKFTYSDGTFDSL